MQDFGASLDMLKAMSPTIQPFLGLILSVICLLHFLTHNARNLRYFFMVDCLPEAVKKERFVMRKVNPRDSKSHPVQPSPQFVCGWCHFVGVEPLARERGVS